MEASEEKGSEWTVGERHRGWRLDRFLQEQIPRLSRSRIQKAITERIRVSWRDRVSSATRVHPGGKVLAGFPRLFEVPESYDFSVLYEDADYLAVDKPAGLVVHPTNSCRQNSLIEILRRSRSEPGLCLVHRLDRETSGVLLLARNREAAGKAGKAMQGRAFQKTYLARVFGKPPEERGVVDRPIGRDPKRRVHVRRCVDESGESATTHYEVERYDGDTTVLRLKPVTGRCHQLRVHCEWLGCPIVGDPLYGHPDSNYLKYITSDAPRERMQLHAWKLEGEICGKFLSIEAPGSEW